MPLSTLASGVRQRSHPSGATRPFFTWSNILPNFPWYRCPLFPLALLPCPLVLTRKTLHHPPPSLLAAFYPAPCPPSICLGPAADGWPLRRGSQEGSGLLSGTFQSPTVGRWRETNWGKIGTDLRKEEWRKNMLGAKEVLKKNTNYSRCADASVRWDFSMDVTF